MPPLPRPSAAPSCLSAVFWRRICSGHCIATERQGPEVLSVFATENEDEIGIRTLVTGLRGHAKRSGEGGQEVLLWTHSLDSDSCLPAC